MEIILDFKDARRPVKEESTSWQVLVWFGRCWGEWGLDPGAQGARSLDGLIGVGEVVTAGPVVAARRSLVWQYCNVSFYKKFIPRRKLLSSNMKPIFRDSPQTWGFGWGGRWEAG